MNPIPLVRSRGILPILKFLKQAGTPIEPLIKQAGLPISALDRPEVLISLYHVFDFAELASRSLGTEHLGILAGQQAQIDDLGIFGKTISQSLTLYDLLNTISALLTTTYNSGAKVWISYQDDLVRFNHKFINTGKVYNQQSQYFACLNHLKIIELLIGPAWQPIAIHFQADKINGLDDIELFSQVRVQFNQPNNAIVFDRSLLRLPLQHRLDNSGDRQQQDYELLNSLAPADDFTESLRQLTRAQLKGGCFNVILAAEAAGTSTRSLQRILAAQGLTYDNLVDRVRFDLAKSWIKDTSISLHDIASELGYSNLANFTRAFKRWTGVSPSHFRNLAYHSTS